MNIRELAELTATPERQIRYMIAEGFVPPPQGGRAKADYGDEHVAAIRRYLALRSAGLTPQSIRAVLAKDMATPFPICPGIALHVDARILGLVDAETLVDRVRQAVADFIKDD